MNARRSRRNRTVHAVAGTVLGALAFVIPVKHAAAHRSAVQHPARHGGRHCDSLAHVGDSLTWQAKVGLGQQYVRRGWRDVRIDAKGGRGIASFMYDDMTGLDAVRRIKAGGFHGCWVMALGTNDTANTDVFAHTPAEQHLWRVGLIKAMMEELNGAQVVWVNTHLIAPDIAYSSQDAAAWNAALREVSTAYPNMQIFDWDTAAKDHPEWTRDDMVHDTPEGSAQRAEIVSRAVTMMLKGTPDPLEPDPLQDSSWLRPFRHLFHSDWPLDAPGP
ncbi:MAG: hypothetical protein RJA49_103 [Actinomycetota bacterium]